MPELPEVETTRKSLQPLLGKTLSQVCITQPKLRWPVPDDLSSLVGYTLTKLERRAKYIIATFHVSEDADASHTKSNDIKHNDTRATEKQLIIHLGMSGSLQQRDLATEPLKHDHVVMQFDNADVKLCYHDPRRFGAILWHHDYAHKLFHHLGPEPLSDEFDADYLHRYVKKTHRPVKAVIMDQACVVGVGNIYATESLFFSGIHPLVPARQLSKQQASALVAHIKTVLQQAIDLGGSTLRDYTHSDGKTGYFQQILAVYGRKGEPCTVCGHTIHNVKITGRASTFCPNCQPLLPNRDKK